MTWIRLGETGRNPHIWTASFWRPITIYLGFAILVSSSAMIHIKSMLLTAIISGEDGSNGASTYVKSR